MKVCTPRKFDAIKCSIVVSVAAILCSERLGGVVVTSEVNNVQDSS